MRACQQAHGGIMLMEESMDGIINIHSITHILKLKNMYAEFTKSDLILLTSMTFHLRSVVASDICSGLISDSSLYNNQNSPECR